LKASPLSFPENRKEWQEKIEKSAGGESLAE
jgi:hypothetical protein